MTSRVIAIVGLALALSACGAIRAFLAGPPPPDWPRPSAPLPQGEARLEVDGPTLDAMVTARADLVKRSQHAVDASGYRSDPVSDCLTRPEIYDVRVQADDADRWVIYVAPRAERCPAIEGLFGGGATYEIAKADGGIRSAEPTE